MVILNVMVEDTGGQPAQVEHAAQWRDQFGLGFEVLADSDETWVNTWGDDGSRNFNQHSYTVLNADLTVAWHELGQSSGTLDALITAAESALPAE